MENQQSKKKKKSLLSRSTKEAREMANKVLKSKLVRELLKDIEEFQKKSESALRYILKEIIGKDLRCKDDLVLLDKMYGTHGNREILYTKIAKKIKGMNFLNIGYEESIIRKVMCVAIQSYYHYKYKENVSEKLMTVTRFQYACTLLWLLCEYGNYMGMEVTSGCEGEHLDGVFLRLYRIGRWVGSLECIDNLEYSRLLEIMMQETGDKS